MPMQTIRCPGYLVQTSIVLLLGLQSGLPVQGAESFGRLFTSPAQRERLDAMRRTGPEITVEISDAELELSNTVQEQAPLNAITLKGVVYRGGGASTAWVNDSNTYEGNIAAQDIQVPETRIGKDHVEMNITGNQSVIQLKVGETYDPATDRKIDLSEDLQPQATGQAD